MGAAGELAEGQVVTLLGARGAQQPPKNTVGMENNNLTQH